MNSEAIPIRMKNATKSPAVNERASLQLFSCRKAKKKMNSVTPAYRAQRQGSLVGAGGSTEIRKVFSGEIFRIETSGRSANRIEISSPSRSPCRMAGQDISVTI